MIGEAVYVVIFVSIIISLYFKSTNPICNSIERIDGKVAVVTGGTAGMGAEIAKDLARRGAKVIIAGPFKDEGSEAREYIVKETGSEHIVFKLLDLASLDSVRKFAQDIVTTEERLDILVNNAGGFFNYITTDGLHATMQINYLGHFLLTILLLPLLKKTNESRIINVGSWIHYFGSTNVQQLSKTKSVSAVQIYADSKLFVALFTKKLSKVLEGTGVSVSTADPGLVGTYILHKQWSNFLHDIIIWTFCHFYKNPWEGAQTAIYACVDVDAGAKTGRYYKDCQETGTSSLVKDEKLAHDVWVESKRLVNISDSELSL